MIVVHYQVFGKLVIMLQVRAIFLGVLIIGLLAFAKKVPNLIKEIFPSLGGAAAFDYGLSFKKSKLLNL